MAGSGLAVLFDRCVLVRHWPGFAFAVSLTGWGMWQMAIDSSYKAFLMVCWLFLLSSAFTLAKMLRDAHECAHAETTP
jgi:hypothetical protein